MPGIRNWNLIAGRQAINDERAKRGLAPVVEEERNPVLRDKCEACGALLFRRATDPKRHDGCYTIEEVRERKRKEQARKRRRAAESLGAEKPTTEGDK